MVLTGKYEDIAPLIYNEMARYGTPPSSIPDPKGKLTSQSTVPVVTSETRKVSYTDTKVSFDSNKKYQTLLITTNQLFAKHQLFLQPNKSSTRDSKPLDEPYIAPPDLFNNSSAVALRTSEDEMDENGELLNSQTVSSKTRTVETLTVSTLS